MPLAHGGGGESEEEDDELEMDQGVEESGADSDESSDAESAAGSPSDDDASSEMDDGESERRRMDCMENMSSLEGQFVQLREELYREKLRLVNEKLIEIRVGNAKEFQIPYQKLRDLLKCRDEIADVRQELRIKNVDNAVEAECQAACQNYESDCLLFVDYTDEELMEKLRRVEQDRHNIDITSDLFNASQSQRRKRACVSSSHAPNVAQPTPDRRRKPVTVQGPYIVLRIREAELIEDWTAIKLAIKQAETAALRTDSAGQTQQTQLTKVRCEDGRLWYNGEQFIRGQRISITRAQEASVQYEAKITNVTPSEITLRREDGVTAKILLLHLQCGKYSIRRTAY